MVLELDDISRRWEAVDTDTVVRYVTEDKALMITVSEHGDGLVVSLERRVSADGYTSYIETFAERARSVDEATDIVTRVMDELDYVNGVEAVAATKETVGDDGFVQFICVFTDLLPDGIELEDLTFDESEGTIEPINRVDLDEDDDLDGIPLRIEIYPVPLYKVETNDGELST